MSFRLESGIAVFGDVDQQTLQQMQTVSQKAVRTALMADNHLGYVMPIGGVAAYRGLLSVMGVGVDIACGNAAIRTNLHRNDFLGHEKELANEIQQTISFGMNRPINRADDAPVNDPLFATTYWDLLPSFFRDKLKEKARAQLGTVGGGNHYVDVFADETGAVWVGVHFGSRGLGFTIANGIMSLALGAEWNTKVKEQEVLLDISTELGQMYWGLLQLAGKYAYVGREWVARKVAWICSSTVEERELVHNHHNFAWRERHLGEDLLVVRKGCTPAWPGQKGFVGGSMGDDAVILQGTPGLDMMSPDGQDQVHALYSTVHGAGRVMGRNDAKKGRAIRDPENPKKVLRRETEKRITREMMNQWLAERGIILRGGEVDEAPHVYRRLPDVLACQGNTVQVLHTLTPFVVVMADGRTYDPYRD